jgi:Ca2+-binding RTX toxin-like protein
VDLNLHTATGVAGGILNIRNVTGSKGDDLLRGDSNPNELRGVAGNDILVGLDGNDHLIARGVDNHGAETTRRCILIGGNGADILEGSEGDDILVGGHFQNNVDTNDTVLKAFLGAWAGPVDYTTRTRYLNQTGVTAGGNYKVNDFNIQRQDHAVDTLTGNGGTDWF